MRIAIDARELRTSTGRYIERLIHYLQQIDLKNHYVIILSEKDFDSWQPTNPNFSKVSTTYREFTFAEQIGFKGQLESLDIDLVHFGMVQQPVLYNKTPVVTTMHDLTTLRFRNPAKNPLIFWLKQRVYARVNKRVARKSRFVITPTEFVKQDIINYTGVRDGKVVVTLESADPLASASEAYQPMVDKRFIMYLGRPTPHKNLARLIDAFSLLQKNHPDLHLVLAGKKDVNYQLHEKRVNEKGIKNVVFTDFISDEQLAWLYENTEAYCFPSLSEGFGLPGLEAMIHGAPVASSNATCLPEVYGEAAHYFDPLDVDDTVRAISEILTDNKLRESLVTKGKKRVKQFSWKRMAEQTLEVYTKSV